MQHPRNSFSDGDVKVGINANGLRFTVPMQHFTVEHPTRHGPARIRKPYRDPSF